MSSRKPAPIVSCQHCKWKGSARGLFTHVRLSHPGITSKPPTAVLKHPLDVNNSTIGTLPIRKKKRSKGSNNDEISILGTLGIVLAIRILESLTQKQTQTLQREGVNPSQVVTALGKIQ